MEINRSTFQNVETSANITNRENKVSNTKLKSILAVNVEKQSINSNENVHLSYWVCLPSKNEAYIINIYTCTVLEREIITLILSQN